MLNVFRILHADLRALFRQFFAVVIVIAILFIPALYAWLNIYANWDPYGNTGNIPIALASRDLGYTDTDGTVINKGLEVMEQVSSSSSIGWVVLDSAEEAIHGVEDGSYYGAIVFGENFSRNMYDLTAALQDENGTITFYQNYKMNAVANKISETAASTVAQNIQTAYLEVVFQTVFDVVLDAGNEIDPEATADRVVEVLGDLRDTCKFSAIAISTFREGSSTLSEKLYNADTSNVSAALGNASGNLASTAESVANIRRVFDEQLDEISARLDDIIYAWDNNAKPVQLPVETPAPEEPLPEEQPPAEETEVSADGSDTADTAPAEPLPDAAVQDITDEHTPSAEAQSVAEPEAISTQDIDAMQEALSEVSTQLEDMRLAANFASPEEALEYTQAIDTLAADTNAASDALEDIKAQLPALPPVDTAEMLMRIRTNLITSRHFVNNTLKPLNRMIFDHFEHTYASLAPLLNNLSLTVDSLNPTMYSAAVTLDAANDTLGYLQDSLLNLSKALDGFINKIEEVRESELPQALMELLEGSAKDFAEFFACPVTVNTEAVYPIENYGSAMAPFYSVLAVWVGCVVNGAIIKTEASPRDLRRVTQRQLYWARFILLQLINQLQTLIIVLGDIYLLGCQCLHPVLFWWAFALTSFTFTAFIYSACLAFGDVGKAIVVVIMVLQIAGSSGTYPVEILSDIFIKLYRFFPFPYAINAVREAMCGVYYYDYIFYLLQLLVFAVFGFLIGLVVRKPFMRVNEFVEEEMEASGVL